MMKKRVGHEGGGGADRNKITRPTLVDLCEERVESLIKAGEWEELLPPVRVLSKTLGVSPPTLANVLSRLTDKGVVVSRGARRRYGIVDWRKSRKSKASAGSGKCVLILTPEPLAKVASSARDILESVERDLHAKGWKVQFDEFDYFHSKSPNKTWDTRLKALQPDCIVAAYGRPVLEEWAATNGIPIYFVGGVAGALATPMLGVSSSSMLRIALRELIAMGHSRIFTPICDREQTYTDSLIGVYKEVFAEANLEFQASLNTPTSDYLSPSVIMEMGGRIIKEFKPTALVVIDWKEFISLFGLCAQHGIRIPQDISVCVLHYDPLSDWFVPSIAHFNYPGRRISKRLEQWIADPSLAGRGVTEFAPEWVAGKSIAPPRE